MQSVAEKLNLENNLDSFAKGDYPYKEYFQIFNYTTSENLKPHDAIVIFEEGIKDINGTKFPSKLKYTIRMMTPSKTQDSEILEEDPPRRHDTTYDSFMRLQSAIDDSFVEVASGSDINQTVSLQDVPQMSLSRKRTLIMGPTAFSILCGLFVTFVILVAKLVGERLNGVQELMKMSGVTTWALSFAHFVDTLPGMLVYAISGTVITSIIPPVIMASSSSVLVFIILFLHSCTIFAVAFAVSYLIRVENYAQILAVVAFLLLWIPASLLVRHTPKAMQILIGIWPFVPVMWACSEITELERIGKGLTFATMAAAHGTTFSTLWAIVFMLIQIPLFLFLAWYLAHVVPGKFGLAMPWNFLCKPQYWGKPTVKPDVDEDVEQTQAASVNQQYFEPPLTHGHIGIRVVNVSKIFLNHRALNNVSLNVYRGELTVLLGHNGAGKTTLMSIMTGMLRPTTGTVYLGGKDISKREDARWRVGFCPQNNMFFPKVSVIEHVVIFSILRGELRAQAWKSSAILLKQLGLEDKAKNLPNQLSGGMKRRLQLACALAGGADILILDEPSSGLDVETRRHLWDLILALRGSRTVLISTHFMEEADALGDRVAALHSGVLRCHASPMFLKKAIGTGYRLTLLTAGPPNEAAITKLVTASVPGATVKETTLNSVSYALPAASSEAFPQLFNNLEAKKSEFGVESIGVGVSTLEEVFLLLCSNIDTSNLSPDEVDGVRRVEPIYQMTKGRQLCFRQICELVKRQILYIYFYKYIFIIGQVIIPIALFVACAMTFKNEPVKAEPGASRTLYEPRDPYRVLHRSHRDIDALSTPYPEVDFERENDVPHAVFRVGKGDVLEYHKYITGVEIIDTHAKVMYTTTVRHAAPAALSLLSDLLANRFAYDDPSLAVPAPAAGVAPVNYATDDRPLHTSRQTGMNRPKDTLTATSYMVFIASIILVTLMPAASLPSIERQSGARWIHLMAGCPPELYWAVHLLFRLALAAVIIIMPVLLIFAFDVDKTFSDSDFLVAIAVILVLGIMAFLAFLYLLSFCGRQMAINIVVFILISFGVILNLIWTVSTGVKAILLSVPLHLLPCQALAHALHYSAQRASDNALCGLNKHLCPALDKVMPGCCSGDSKKCYFCIDGPKSPGYSMMLLLIHFLVYMTLVLMTQRKIIQRCVENLQAILAAKKKPPRAACSDDMVLNERAYVKNTINLPTKQIPDAMLVSKVYKYFGLTRSFCAIKGVSFSVKKGECLGLLGVNGAGKSSTFRVLTAENWATFGQVYAAGLHRKGFSTDYIRQMSYCPQFFGTDHFLTGRQNLVLLLSLKGLNRRDARTEADSWIRIVGLEKYSNRTVDGYSGGCERRLVAAAALCLGAPLTLMDEPTSGVDVSARRRVWAALRRGLAHQRAVIITSHSMDEMEALCHRIAIMAAGNLCALDSPGELRAAYALGHAVIIKVRQPPVILPDLDEDKPPAPKKGKKPTQPTQQPVESQAQTAQQHQTQPQQTQQTQTQQQMKQPEQSRPQPQSAKAEQPQQTPSLEQPVDESSREATQLNELKNMIEKTFNCTLKDEHKTMLHYHINETLPYSKLFQEMERLKRAFPDYVEDYSVTETTLEEVFLSFAKYNEKDVKTDDAPQKKEAKSILRNKNVQKQTQK